jgi:hypothetical protein
MSATGIVQRLNARRSGEGWKANCPAHIDKTPSLSINEGSDGRVLLKCFAGCDVDSICAALNIRVADLFPAGSHLNGVRREKTVSEARTGATNQPESTETKPTSVQPRPLGELLDDVVGFLRKWVVFQYPEQAAVCSLWALHTWLFKAFDYSPYLWVFAADMRSGKSRLLEALSLLTHNPELTESGSSAALIRSIDENNPPTFLLDEIDCVYGNKKNDVEADSLRRFLNAGFKRGATFLRCVGQGSNQVPTKFPAFCPKAMAGIGRDLPATVQDRSVPIELTRQTREERADRLRDREARHATASIKAELKALSEQSELIDDLRQARPELPEKLSDRAQDITEPLIAIADHAGGHWPEDARAALVKLYGQEEDASFGVKLLIAVKAAFGKENDKLTTRQLLAALVDMEDGPWASMFEDALKHDKLQTAASKLARILKSYKRTDGEKIKPRPIKLDGETVRGFCRDDFEAAWRHWLPPSPSVTSVTSVTHEGKTVTLKKKVTPGSVTELTGVTLNQEGKMQKVTQVTPVTLTPEEGKNEADGLLVGLLNVVKTEAADGLWPKEHPDCPWGYTETDSEDGPYYPAQYTGALDYLSSGNRDEKQAFYHLSSVLYKIEAEAMRGTPLCSNYREWQEGGYPEAFLNARVYMNEQMVNLGRELLTA